MASLTEVQSWRGKKLVDVDGDKIGTIEDVYLDRHTGEPEWATVKMGLLGMKSSFVPIHDAERIGEDEIRVALQKEHVKDAAKIDPDRDLTRDDERQLYEHYGRGDYEEWRGEDRTTALGLADEEQDRLSRAPEGAGAVGEPTPAVVGIRLRRLVIVRSGVGTTADPGEGREPMA